MACFVDLEAVKTALGIPLATTKFDAVLGGYVAATNAELLAWFCLDQCEPTTYTVTADFPLGETVSAVRLGPYPVVSITSIEVGGETLSAESYVLRQSLVKLCSPCRCRSYRRGEGCRDFRAVYVAGFDEADPWFAMLQAGATALAAGMFRAGAGGDLKSEQVGRHRKVRFTAEELGSTGPLGYPPILTRALGHYERRLAMLTALPDDG